MGSVFVRRGFLDRFVAPGSLFFLVVRVASSFVHYSLSWWVVVLILSLV